MNVKIIGLGRASGDISVRGLEEVKRADFVVLKSEKFDGAKLIKELGISYTALDEFYEKTKSFDELNGEIIKFILAKAKESKSLVYLVNGGGADDVSAAELMAVGAELIPAASSGIYGAAAALSVFGAGESSQAGTEDMSSAYTEIAASELIGLRAFFPDKRVSLIVTEVDDKLTAGEVKLCLSDIYGDETAVLLCSRQGTEKTVLSEIDRKKKSCYGYNTFMVVPPSDFCKSAVHDLSDLYLVMKRLRGKDGCSWDREQTHESIAINAIEESAELVDAIEKKDIAGMLEESGDVLLQALFHAVIAEDTGEFSIRDMLTALCKKLLSRHAHVFGDERASSAASALLVWEKEKDKEKHFSTLTEKLEALPKSFPALLRSEKALKNFAKYFFEIWRDSSLDSLKLKLDALNSARVEDRQSLGGDILLLTAAYLRSAGVTSETALRSAVERFIEKAAFAEQKILAEGKRISEMTNVEKIRRFDGFSF